MKNPRSILFLALILSTFVFPAALYGTTSHVTSLSIGGSIVANSAGTATGTIQISRDPTDTDADFVYLGDTGGHQLYYTCQDGGSSGYGGCSVPAGQSVTLVHFFWPFEIPYGGAINLNICAGIQSCGEASGSLTVQPPSYSLTVSPGTLIPGSTQHATVTVSRSPAPLNQVGMYITASCCMYLGNGVSLTGSSASANIDASNIANVYTSTSVTLCASLSGGDCQAQASLTLLPFVPTITVDTSTIQGGSTETGTGHVTMNATMAYSNGITLSQLPNYLFITQYPVVPAGGSSATFTFQGYTVNEPQTVTLTAQYGGGPTSSTTVRVTPAAEPHLPCPECEGQAANPINLINGNVWVTERDYTLPGLGGGLQIERTWNSLWHSNADYSRYVGMFGDSWRSTYEEALAVLSTNSVRYYRANGDSWWFSWDPASNAYLVVSPTTEHATLSFNTTTALYTLALPDGTQRVFNNSGYLTAVVDRNGNQTTVAYDSSNRITTVTDAASRSITFTYNNPYNYRTATTAADSTGTIATYTYGASSYGQLTSVTYADGSQANFTYDNSYSLLLTSVTDGQGKLLESHTYDSYRRGLTSSRAGGVDSVTVSYPSGASTTLTDSQSNATTYWLAYAGPERFVTGIDGSGCASCGGRGQSSFGYDGNGYRTSSTDAQNTSSRFSYDGQGNTASKSVQLDSTHSVAWNYTYNNFNELVTSTDPLGNTTSNSYDSHGNLLSTTTPSPDGTTAPSVTGFSYNTQGQLLTITDPLNHATTLAYYPSGLIHTITDAQSHVTTYAYDARGNRTSVTDALNHTTQFAYDVMNRVTQITYPDSTTVQFGYDYRGRRTSVTDQNGKVTSYACDDADRLTSVTDAQTPTHGVTTYAYDSENNLTSITDANGHTTSFTYNNRGWVTQTTFPSGHSESYTYDGMGNLASKTDRNGNTINYSYDALYRLTQKQLPGGANVNYSYDAASRLSQVTDATGTYGFTYDNMGRLTGTSTDYAFDSAGAYTVQYGYDAASNRVSMIAPDGSTNSYSYDTLNRLSNLSSSLTGSFGFSYDALSRRTQLTRPNGVNTNYTYDNLSRLLSVLHQAGSTTLDGASYTYDAAGNRTTKADYLNSVTWNYTYDPLYQLTQVTQGSSTTESYSYDAVGNRLSSLGVSPYQYNSSNELISLPSAAYTYDYSGNTTSKTDSTGTMTYNWDAENRLASVVLPASGGTVSFKYDPFGRRVQKISARGTVDYVYDGDDVAEEVDNSGNVQAGYTRGDNIDEPLSASRFATNSYYQPDGLGSITSLSGSGGSLVSTYVADSFGDLITSTGTFTNQLRYTGREFDSEIGLYYYRARYYDSTIGRFLNEDLLGFNAGNNFYRYVENNPLNFIDPFGLSDLVVDRQHGTLTVVGSNGQVINVYPAGNSTTNPAGDPNTVGSNGPAPTGTFPVQPHVNTQGRPEYGPAFFPVGAVDNHGRPADIARQRGIGIHGGRRGPQSRTQGCIRVSDQTVRDLINLDASDPIRTVTIR